MSENAIGELISDLSIKATLGLVKPKLLKIINANKDCLTNPQQPQSLIAGDIIESIYIGVSNPEQKEIIRLIGKVAIVRVEQDAAFREKFDVIMQQITDQYKHEVKV